MLEVNNLSRSYGNFKAVDQVTFKMSRGEIVGLLGHNGAGKTTIMKMMSGYLEPDQGSVKVDGVEVSHDPNTVQRSLGYLPESLPVYPEMTVADYLDYAADLKGISPEAKEFELRRVVDQTDIRAKLWQPISTLSRGYKQRVGVAQAILGQPKLLILDEPTNGLDPTQTEQMRTLIRGIARDATVILSTHILQEVEALCGRVLILRGGRLVVDSKLSELKDSRRLLVATSAAPEQARELLEPLEPVHSVEHLSADSQEGQNTFRLSLENSVEQRTAAAAIARALHDAGAELYQLQPEVEDLESLFKQFNQPHSREVSHAA